MHSQTRIIGLYTCCGNRAVAVNVNPDQLAGEAWRLARCLVTTDYRHRESGVLVRSTQTNRELAQAAGWTPERVTQAARMCGRYWGDSHPVIDWRFRAFHVWPDHRNGPHPDPDAEALGYHALAYLQREAGRIVDAGGTVVAAGDFSVCLAADSGYGENTVLLPDEQAEAELERGLDALFGTRH